MNWKVAVYSILVLLGSLSSVLAVQYGKGEQPAVRMESEVPKGLKPPMDLEYPLEAGISVDVDVEPSSLEEQEELVPLDTQSEPEEGTETISEPVPTETDNAGEIATEPVGEVTVTEPEGEGQANPEVQATPKPTIEKKAKPKKAKATPKPKPNNTKKAEVKTDKATSNKPSEGANKPKKAKKTTKAVKTPIPKQDGQNGQIKAVRDAVAQRIRSARGGLSYSRDLENAAILRARGVGKNGMDVLVKYGGSGWKSVKWGETRSQTFVGELADGGADGVAEILFRNLSRSTYASKKYKKVGVGIHVSEEDGSLRVSLSALFTD